MAGRLPENIEFHADILTRPGKRALYFSRIFPLENVSSLSHMRSFTATWSILFLRSGPR